MKQYIREKLNPVLLFLYKINGIKVHDNLLFCPQDQKQAFVKSSYLKRPDIRTFIETGTYKGDTVQYVKDDFEKIFTIELSEKYANDAIERFKDTSKVIIIKGDSALELPKLSKEINEPCVFWLDGHYSYGDTAKSEKKTPILEEIKSVLETNLNHLILIDDARLFIGRHNYPSLIRFASFVKKVNKSYKISVSKDIIILQKDESST